MDNPILRLEGVSKTFPGPPPVAALVDVSLEVATGESLAVVGPSGSGKSTLLNILGCLDRCTEGRYLLADVDVAELNDGGLAAIRAEFLGFVFQSFHLLSHRTVLENVMLAEIYEGVGVPHHEPRDRSRSARRARAEEALRRVGLSHRIEFRPTTLSGGERQRVAIARAIVHQPRVLLADEPTGNLDSENTEAVLTLFDDLRSDGLTIVTITHDLEVAARFDRRVVIRDGRLLADGPAQPDGYLKA